MSHNETLRLIKEQFEALYSNIRKSKNNVKTKELIQKHSNTLNEKVNEFRIILENIKEDIKSEESYELFVEYNDLLEKRKLALAILNNTAMTTPTDSTAAFDVRTATAVVQQYDGASDGLQAFVDSANLMKELTVPGQQPMLLKFLKTRITGKARIGLPENINSFDEFIKNITERCQDMTSPEQILAKLKCIKQKENLDTFCEQVESLSDKLKNIYLQQKIPGDVANKMVNKAAVDALISGVSNSETKLILKAGSFDNVKTAILKVQENSTNSPNTAILNFSARGHHRQGGNRPSRFGRQNQSNQPNRQYFNNHRTHNGTQNNYRFRENFRNNSQRNTTNFGGRGRFYNRNNSGRMFPIAASQTQTPEINNQVGTPMQNSGMIPTYNQQNPNFLGLPTALPQGHMQNQVQFSR